MELLPLKNPSLWMTTSATKKITSNQIESSNLTPQTPPLVSNTWVQTTSQVEISPLVIPPRWEDLVIHHPLTALR